MVPRVRLLLWSSGGDFFDSSGKKVAFASPEAIGGLKQLHDTGGLFRGYPHWCVEYGFHIPARKEVAAQTTEFSGGPAKDAVTISQQFGKSYPGLWNKASATRFLQAATKIANGQAGA